MVRVIGIVGSWSGPKSPAEAGSFLICLILLVALDRLGRDRVGRLPGERRNGR